MSSALRFRGSGGDGEPPSEQLEPVQNKDNEIIIQTNSQQRQKYVNKKKYMGLLSKYYKIDDNIIDSNETSITADELKSNFKHYGFLEENKENKGGRRRRARKSRKSNSRRRRRGTRRYRR